MPYVVDDTWWAWWPLPDVPTEVAKHFVPENVTTIHAHSESGARSIFYRVAGEHYHIYASAAGDVYYHQLLSTWGR